MPKKPTPKKVTILQIPCYMIAFDSVDAATKALSILSKGIAVTYDPTRRGMKCFVDEDEARRREFTLQTGCTYHPPQENLALPERGTHPALYDPKLA
jgi:hypothetical protein